MVSNSPSVKMVTNESGLRPVSYTHLCHDDLWLATDLHLDDACFLFGKFYRSDHRYSDWDVFCLRDSARGRELCGCDSTDCNPYSLGRNEHHYLPGSAEHALYQYTAGYRGHGNLGPARHVLYRDCSLLGYTIWSCHVQLHRYLLHYGEPGGNGNLCSCSPCDAELPDHAGRRRDRRTPDLSLIHI